MYIVKRPFRDAHGMVPAGSVVEPAGLKRFKRHLLEGHIVEVNEQNFKEYATFFKQRYGVDLKLPSVTTEPIKKVVEAKETSTKTASTEATPSSTTKSVKVKAPVKTAKGVSKAK